MIPKIIHYCWFGQNDKPKLAKKCIKSWKKHCPNYQIVEWNEDNYDISSAPEFVREAYKEKKWAFVSDYVRLKVVFDNGGVYFDTDVELIKNIDFLLGYDAFFGFEDEEYVATGLGFGAQKGFPIVREMMDMYEELNYYSSDGSVNLVTCPVINTKVLLKYGLVQNNDEQILRENVLILPSSFMCPIDYRNGNMKKTENTISIHWYSASWYTSDQRIYRDFIVRKTKLQRILGDRKGEIATKIMYRLFFRKERQRLMKM